MKLVQTDNVAAHYRASIYKLMDQELDSDFCFGDRISYELKKLDYSLLKHQVTEVHNRLLGRGWYWQEGILSLLHKDYDRLIFVGEPRCLSTWAALFLGLFYRKKRTYVWTHGWYGKENLLERIVKRLFFMLPSGGVILYGNYARGLMIKEGFKPEKLFVIHNSLAYDKQIVLRNSLRPERIYQDHFGNGNLNLFFVGRLTRVKQLDMAIKALAKCQEKGYHYNLTLIGDGEVKEELVRLTEKLGLTDSVWFYGGCYDEAELGRMIYNADLCVSPGNVGLTAMHTMVFGTPVVTHNDFAHQMPEFEAIHEGVTGSFYEYGKVESLADCIIRWFKDHQYRREEVRQACYHEIDTQWTPQFQLDVLKKVLYAEENKYC